MKRIGIDARFYGSLGKGLGRYVQKLIENLEKIDAENKYFVFLRRENFEEYVPQNKNFQKILADYRWYTFSEQINMPRLLKKYKLDLVHFPHFNVPIFYFGKFVITIHDLILVHFPTVKGTTLNPFFYWLKYKVYKLVIWLAIKKARRIITVSEFSKKDLLKHYNISQEKIRVTYEACDIPGEKQQKSNSFVAEANFLLSEKYGIIKPYALYVGNAYPHKNLERLISVFENINKKIPELQLVLVGKMDYFYERLKKETENKGVRNVVFLGFVPDEDLNFVYSNARCYVFPSLYEGFGLPPLEAMTAGVPVAAANNSCLEEILGEAAVYFDGKNKQEIEDAILKVFDDEIKCELIKKGFKQVRKYNWKKMARETLNVYDEK